MHSKSSADEAVEVSFSLSTEDRLTHILTCIYAVDGLLLQRAWRPTPTYIHIDYRCMYVYMHRKLLCMEDAVVTDARRPVCTIRRVMMTMRGIVDKRGSRALIVWISVWICMSMGGIKMSARPRFPWPLSTALHTYNQHAGEDKERRLNRLAGVIHQTVTQT